MGKGGRMGVAAQSYATVEVRTEGPIAIVALNRPDVLNAVSLGLLADVQALFGAIDDDPDVWVVVLHGNGRAFSVGADLKERAGMTLEEVRRRRRLAPGAYGAVAGCTKPVIGAVHGFALGGGFEFALCCDLLIAAEGAQFGLPETRLGVIPAGGGTQRLTRLIGPARAKELIFTARRFGTDLALDWGIISRATPPDDLLPTALALAREMAANAPIGLQQAKKAINAALDLDLRTGIAFEAEAYQTCLTTADRNEGLAAARERRVPRFTGA